MTLLPFVVEQGGQQKVFAAFHGVRINLEQTQQARHGRLHPVGQSLGVVGFGCIEGTHDVDRNAGCAAGRVNGHLHLLPQPADAFAVLTPRGQPRFPQLRLLRGKRVGFQTLAAGILLVDPGTEIPGAQVRKGEQKIAQVSLGVDNDGRNVVHGRLFEQRKTQAGLAAPGHTHADRMGHKIAGIVKQRSILAFFGGGIIGAPEIEGPELFEESGIKWHAVHDRTVRPDLARIPLAETPVVSFLGIMQFLLRALFLLIVLAAPVRAELQKEFIILSGGPSLDEWEKYKSAPHDRWWGNFIRAARVRIEQLRKEYGPAARITWLVYSPGYARRGQRQDKADLLSNIISVRDKYGVNLIFFDRTEQVINYLNYGQPRGQVKIAGFEFYGHSNRACFMFDYSNEIDSASKVWLHQSELKKIHRGLFTRDAPGKA